MQQKRSENNFQTRSSVKSKIQIKPIPESKRLNLWSQSFWLRDKQIQ